MDDGAHKSARGARFGSRRELVEWLREPVMVGDAPLNRYLQTAYESQRPIRRALGGLRGDAATRFLCWVIVDLRPPRELLPPPTAMMLLNAPARFGAEWGVTRLLEYLHERRPDLRHEFRDLDGEDGRRFVTWVLRTARHELDLPDELLPRARWLDEPAPRGGVRGVNRYLYDLHAESEELQAAFPDLEGEDGEHFVQWAREEGVASGEIAPALLPSEPDTEVERAATAAARAPASVLPQEWSTTLAGETAESPWGVNVIGYLDANFGIGEATRLLAAGLQSAEVPLLRWSCGHHQLDGHEGGSNVPSESRELDRAPYRFNLVGINAPELVAVRDELKRFGRRFTIGSWWWEVHERLPDPWLPGALYVDEIWVASQHVAEALSGLVPVPVEKVTMPVVRPSIEELSRQDLGLPDGYLFLFMFDYFSSIARKNPVDVIRAFRRAFPPGSGAKLVVKSINGESSRAKRELVRGAIGGHPDIELIDGLIPAQRKDAILAACDSYVSLHRAEGFGIPLAEAMAMGKPVIATNYSGNLEFMNAGNSYLVDSVLSRVGDESVQYPSGAVWGEPDVGHAAELMRQVFENPEEAHARGVRAAEEIARRHSLRAAGESMRARLELLTERDEKPSTAIGSPAKAGG